MIQVNCPKFLNKFVNSDVSFWKKSKQGHSMIPQWELKELKVYEENKRAIRSLGGGPIE